MTKKIATLLIAMVMLVAFTLPTFASNSTRSDKTDTSPNKPITKAMVETLEPKVVSNPNIKTEAPKEPKVVNNATIKAEETKTSSNAVTLTLTAGKNYTLKNHEEGIVYLSSDPLVATISNTGEVKALKAGNCIFTRINTKDKKATYNVVVEGNPTITQETTGTGTSVTSTETLEMIVGHLYKLSNHKAGVTYKLSNTELLTINSEGVMSAKKAGTGSVIQSVDSIEVTYPITIVAAPK